ncbi:major capsid protein L1 [Human papillomavirus 120]|uniref:Major capsid protein L1 n=1 Tax=Human papillomavirus 120 TaxID=765052 RepID=D7P172_9PAPI|nr:major capsid protein L1 [Human papillomavirus 120]
MTLWLPTSGKIYLPPTPPVARVQSTDEYVERTDIYYHATSDRLLTVGHPYFDVRSQDGAKIDVPKVSGNQYRAFRVTFPDPNKFALGDMTVHDPDKYRLVWACKGLEIGRGQPLGIGSTGHPLFNRLRDSENPSERQEGTPDDRQNVSFDPKQVQMFIIGCTPCVGEYWDTAPVCKDAGSQLGLCPPLELKNSVIEDGDMFDIGFGNINNKTLSYNKSDVSLDIVNEVCKYPDFLTMSNDVYGDACFFCARREQCYARHYFVRGGQVGDAIPDEAVQQDHKYYLPSDTRRTLENSTYFPTVSGSLVTSDAQLFNRPFWLKRAQGHNNGILWNNQIFVTVADNTRNTNFSISVKSEDSLANYNASNIREYMRHVEEYQLSFILQLCRIPLKAEVLTQINAMNSDILENWQLGFVPTPDNAVHDTYRYLASKATKCPDAVPETQKEDPFGKYSFWNVDMKEKLSLDLDQYPLGRKFLFQIGLQRVRSGIKRPTPKKVTKTVKKRRVQL